MSKALVNRIGRVRDEARLRRQRLYDFQPESTLFAATTAVDRAAVPAVDVHNHLGYWLRGDDSWMVDDVPHLVAEMDELNVSALVNLDGRWSDELQHNLDRYDRRYPGRFVTFCQLDWSLVDRPQALLESLRRSAAAGAGGLKVWKDLGLHVRDGAGHIVRPDDERLGDVWELAGELGLPVLMHTADPVAFWRPIDRHNERFEELARHPEWHHGSRPVPRHGDLMESFEALVAAHPRTTVIAAHVASYAENLDAVGSMLDRYPNLHVDVAACESQLGRQPRRAARFMTDHADRVLWGTDAFPFSIDRYRTWFRFLESSDEYFPYSSGPPEQGRWSISGLGLPATTLAALYRDNVRRIVPALT